MTLPKSIYFKTRGRAEVIRLALAEAAVPYEEENFETADFPALKASGRLPFLAVPVWEQEGFRLAQSYAILNHVGRTHGLRGKSTRDEALIDQALGSVEDIRNEYRKLVSADPAKRPAVRAELTEKVLPRWFGQFEKLLGANAFLVGEAISVADLALWFALEMAKDNGFGAALGDTPRLNAFSERIASRERIKAYLESPNRKPLTKFP